MPFELTQGQKDVLATDGHIIVRGGPGSGKTTVSILKAGNLSEAIRPSQRVLFLSFARATVSRVLEAIAEEESLTPKSRRSIEVDTYHSFFWKILKTHGYLHGWPRKLSLLTPPEESITVSHITAEYKALSKLSDDEKEERERRISHELLARAETDGLVCFDLFAPSVADLLESSSRLCRLVASKYPIIVLDEFQDTNQDQWRVVRALGTYTTLIALADPEQRIFDFIGADPKRLDHFIDAFAPTEFDLAGDNHRSKGTDITVFGNDILRGKFSKSSYEGVQFGTFPSVETLALIKLKTETFAARTRLTAGGRSDWSIAVLVPTKKLTRIVSDSFRAPTGKLPAIHHDATVDMEGAILGANIVACLMQPKSVAHLHIFVHLIADYHRGKYGHEASNASVAKGTTVLKAYERMTSFAARGKALPANSIMIPMMDVYETARALKLSGDPDKDWTAIRQLMENGDCKHLREIGIETRNVRLLDRGTQLRQALNEDWRAFGEYRNAVAIVRAAFVQEHFSSRSKVERGVFVMNMHKAKGKQFDEVIIFEGWPVRYKGKVVSNANRIVRQNDAANLGTDSRQNFRVSVTRAKKRTTILTPADDVCVLFA